MGKVSIFEKIIWTVYIFILIFAPPFIPYPHLLLAVFSAALLVTNYRKYWLEVFRKSKMKSFLVAFIVLVMYVCTLPLAVSLLLNDIVSLSHYLTIFNRFAVLIVTVVPCAGLFLSTIIKDKLDYHFFVETVIGAGIMQGTCALLAYLSPSIKGMFVSLMRRFAGSSIYNNTWYITVRSYGFSRTLVDVFGLGIALIAGMSFFYGIMEKRRYIFYSLIICIAAVLNSRTGLILYLVAVIVAVVYLSAKGSARAVLITVLGICVVFFAGSIGLEIIAENSYTSNWITAGFESIKYFFENRTFSGESGDSLGNLFKNQSWKLPGVFRTIIGTGHSLFQASGYMHSDVGYVNDIWIFGIFGCILLYGSLIRIAGYIIKKSRNDFFRFIAIYFTLCFLVFNIKGATIGYNPGATVLLLVFFGLSYFIRVNNRKE